MKSVLVHLAVWSFGPAIWVLAVWVLWHNALGSLGVLR